MGEALHAVVTGGGSGIGAAVARRLRQEGLRLTLMGRSLDKLRAQQAELAALAGAAAVQIQVCDVGDEASVRAAFAAAVQAQGPVDVLVNNAGQVETAPLARTSLDSWNRLLQVNLTGSFLCSREVAPAMAQRGFGRIVNVASTAALKGYAYVAAYCAAKHGVLGLTRAMALELATKGVTVNAVCPGYTETDIVANAVDTIVAKTGRTAEAARAELAAANPQGRLVQPDEVAAAVAYLLRHDAGAITGQAIAVCGGEVM
ncbi:SDR family oxidoreductase [Pelomonas sp. CA6]|uniref:SDR family NAD(P)-dependent oxidoreductase n=1 Tax=Pelomonas sp. CA6 TaxID=2907999 RepID=UPI001F4BCFEC|nr:SDR family oxidoreductase [Pelomonas sp. CA6]MCH7345136.1 SDR family oxidoreductase [Pelomonas sp. CA6]